MTEPEHSTYNTDEERDRRLVAWRLDRFMDMGIDALAAARLAVRRDIDRVKVERMVDAGATTAEILGILI